MRLIRVKSPFDYIVVGPKTLFIDAKSCSAALFPAVHITPHQLRDLMALTNRGHVAGYLVNFVKFGMFSFFGSDQIQESFETRKGMKPENAIANNPSLDGLIQELVGISKLSS